MRRWLSLAILAGCAVGPNYQPPENDVADAWSTEMESSEPPVSDWWNLLNDPLLTKYMNLAAENNLDILIAESHILQARALRQMAAASFWPQVGADVNATKTYFSKNGPVFAIGPAEAGGTGGPPGTVSPGTGLPFGVQVPQVQPLYNALFDVSWELDLFGKTRRSVEAADGLIGRTIEQRNDTLITIMAEIARNYLELRGTQKRLSLIEENISILEKKAVLIRGQLAVGLVSRLDDENIQATLASERAVLPDLEAEIHRNIYTLSVLIGTVPETLLEELLTPQPLPSPPPHVAVGLRSDLLRRRPDIRRAERDLAIATAHIGVAVASFFPTITLLADGGLQSLMVKNLFSLGSKTWALGGDITMPIFQGGRLMGNLKAKRAESAAAAHTYQQTILTALQETESILALYTKDLITTREREAATHHTREIVSLSQARYQTGVVDRLALLEAERQLNLSNQSLLDAQLKTVVDLVSLYKALGGGWELFVE